MAPFDARLARLPGIRPVSDTGKISYSLYLIHFPIITAVMALIPGRASLIFWIASLPLPFLVGWAFSFVAERPFRRALRLESIPVAEPLAGNPQIA
jgi:peptidoglycan/LPS O-acetylase OafA/YrhL